VSDISPSSIKTDAEFEKAVSECTDIESIKKLMHERELQQGLVRQDPFNAEVLHPVEQSAVPQKVSETITYGNGQTKTFVGDSADDLQKQQIAFFRSLETAAVAAQPRDDAGRFTPADQGKLDEAAQLEIVRKSNLELAFKRGELSTADYLNQSGALAEAIGKHNETVQTQQAADEKVVTDWQQAVEEFKHSEAGADWIPCKENTETISDVLRQMDAQDSPNAEHLKRAWKCMKEQSLFVETADSKMQKALASAQSPEEIRDALGMNDRDRARSSGFFGSR
jgi:hypothetical protein